MANKISVIVDVAADKAVSGIKGFRKSIDDADGAVGKMKAGASSAFDSIKANAGTMAVAAGAALVTFGAKSIAAFQDVALEAGKFRDITGVALEDASKWIAVGDDIGVSAQVLEKSFGKLNVEIGKGGKALEEFGIDVVKAKDGTVDANATFLNAIDVIKGIQDPTKKAQAAQAAFGKGWQQMAELINMGSADIVKAMEEVSDAQVVDESELAKARKFRETLDKLGDSVRDVAIDVGEELVPAVTVAADVLAGVAPVAAKMAKFVGDSFVGIADSAYALGQSLADMADALPFVEMAETVGPTLYEWSKLERATGELVAKFAEGNPTMEEFTAKLDAAGLSAEERALAIIEYRKQLDAANTTTGEAVEATDELTEAVNRTKDGEEEAAEMIEQVNDTYNAQVEAVEAAEDALRELTEAMIDQVGNAFNLEQATLNLESAYAAYEVSVMETTATLADSEATDREKEQALRDLRDQELGVAADALATAEAYAEEMGAADGSTESARLQKEKLQELAAAMPELRDEIQLYIDKLNLVPDVIRTRFEITATGATVTPHGDFIGIPGGARAAGGPVSAGSTYLVGERGMELFTPAVSGYITPHNAIAGGWGNTGAAAAAPGNVTLVVEGNIYGDKHLRAQLDTWARGVQRESAGAK